MFRALFVGSLLVISLLTKTTPESAHEYSRLGTVESLVQRQTFQLDDSTFIDTLDKVYRDGHYYSHQPPLLALIEAPVYWALHLPGLRFNNRGRLVLTYLFSLMTNGLALALTIVVFGKILDLGGVASPARDVYAVVLPFGTWLLPYGLVANNHGISGLLLAIAIYFLLTIEWHGATISSVSGAGLALGLLSGIELLPLISFLPLAVVYFTRRRDLDLRMWLALAAAVGLPLVAHAAANVTITGDVIPAGFHHELFNYPGSAFDDSTLTGTIKYDSVGDAARYAWTALVSGKGYFAFAPILALGVIAGLVEWRWWSRARGVYLVLIGGTLLSLAASILTTNNFGGGAVGFRHATYLAPALLALLLPWLASPAQPRRAVVMVVAVLSMVSMIAFTSPRPWWPLTVDRAALGAWHEYAPLPFRLATGRLLEP
jgi:hypothetical protein